MGVLLFQDLAVVPLLVLIPALGSRPRSLLPPLGLGGAQGGGAGGLLLTGGQRVMRWWLTLVARRKSEELFMLNLLLITLGLAWLTEHAGLSLALGAFIAGMLVAETEYKHQVEHRHPPLPRRAAGPVLHHHRHDAGLAALVLDRWPLVLVLVTVPVLASSCWWPVLARLGATTGVALRTGLYLAQAGEFGFVLLTLTPTTGWWPAAG
jgi:CPA2 family monovalent cation:H+ antiporter-2